MCTLIHGVMKRTGLRVDEIKIHKRQGVLSFRCPQTGRVYEKSSDPLARQALLARLLPTFSTWANQSYSTLAGLVYSEIMGHFTQQFHSEFGVAIHRMFDASPCNALMNDVSTSKTRLKDCVTIDFVREFTAILHDRTDL
jgi:hypothetical protein